jgi:hypothetical protein
MDAGTNGRCSDCSAIFFGPRIESRGPAAALELHRDLAAGASDICKFLVHGGRHHAESRDVSSRLCFPLASYDPKKSERS